MTVRKVCGIGALVVAADVLSTWWALSHLGGYESNAIASAAMSASGAGVALFVLTALRLALLRGLMWAGEVGLRGATRAAVAACTVVVGWWALVDVSNVMQIASAYR